MTHSAYILNVSPRYLAVYPTIAGPNIKPENPSVVILETVREIGSVDTLMACRITIAPKFAVNKPKITNAGIIKYKFEVNIHINRIDDPITEKYPPTTFSLKYFINVLADSLAAISPALKNTITSPPKNKGAIKSFVSHKEDQSIMIPIVAKLNINNIPKIKTCFFGN